MVAVQNLKVEIIQLILSLVSVTPTKLLIEFLSLSEVTYSSSLKIDLACFFVYEEINAVSLYTPWNPHRRSSVSVCNKIVFKPKKSLSILKFYSWIMNLLKIRVSEHF